MPKSPVFAALAFLLFSSQLQAIPVCRWSIEGTNSLYEQSNDAGVYNNPPRIVTEGDCGRKICTGLVYCDDGNFPVPFVTTAACEAINGRCPSATVCADDPYVIPLGSFPVSGQSTDTGSRGERTQ